MMFRNEGIPHEPPGLDDGRPSMSVDARATTTDGVERGWGVSMFITFMYVRSSGTNRVKNWQ